MGNDPIAHPNKKRVQGPGGRRPPNAGARRENAKKTSPLDENPPLEETLLDPTPEEKPNHVTSTQMNEAQPKRVMPGVNMMPGFDMNSMRKAINARNPNQKSL